MPVFRHTELRNIPILAKDGMFLKLCMAKDRHPAAGRNDERILLGQLRAIDRAFVRLPIKSAVDRNRVMSTFHRKLDLPRRGVEALRLVLSEDMGKRNDASPLQFFECQSRRLKKKIEVRFFARKHPIGETKPPRKLIQNG